MIPVTKVTKVRVKTQNQKRKLEKIKNKKKEETRIKVSLDAFNASATLTFITGFTVDRCNLMVSNGFPHRRITMRTMSFNATSKMYDNLTKVKEKHGFSTLTQTILYLLVKGVESELRSND